MDQDKGNQDDNEENPRDVSFKALKAMPSQGKENVALLRTAAMHLYTWRGAVDASWTSSWTLQSDSNVVTPVAVGRAVRERQAEEMLLRATELEPFHVPTLAALAFVLLQRGSEGAVTRAKCLLEKAVKCGGRGGGQ